ncbi:hypothetical protein ACJMK2_017431 [Sinanodonta woodiana]|uniref:Uncharacterized protein n=1 Tax=Sinanodonta woodiana TaxID=1069815 RepID=A0ABD3UAF9_SINWO
MAFNPVCRARLAERREEHLDPNCGYVKSGVLTINGSNLNVCPLTRRCVCGKETDQSQWLQQEGPIAPTFGDGVELHLLSNNDNNQMCDYSVQLKPRGSNVVYVHQKVCYCFKDA